MLGKNVGPSNIQVLVKQCMNERNLSRLLLLLVDILWVMSDKVWFLMHGTRDKDGAILSKAMGSRTEILFGLSSTYLAT
jgi:hypothetical protein